MTRSVGQRLSVVRSASVVLNSAGYGYCTITCPNGVRWDIGQTSVFTNISAAALQTTPAQPVVKIYQASAPSNLGYIEGTNSGDQDSSDTSFALLQGDSLTAEWTTPTDGVATHAGLLATFVIRGLQYQIVPG